MIASQPGIGSPQLSLSSSSVPPPALSDPKVPSSAPKTKYRSSPHTKLLLGPSQPRHHSPQAKHGKIVDTDILTSANDAGLFKDSRT